MISNVVSVLSVATSFNYSHSELAIIESVSDNGLTITLTEPLKYLHLCEYQYVKSFKLDKLYKYSWANI